jgi:hypothetical protein
MKQTQNFGKCGLAISQLAILLKDKGGETIISPFIHTKIMRFLIIKPYTKEKKDET